MTYRRVLDVLHEGGGIEGAVEHVAHPKHQPSRAAIRLGSRTEAIWIYRVYSTR